MSKAMPKGLKKAIKNVLNQGLSKKDLNFSTSFTRDNLGPQEIQAVDHLIDLGVFQLAGRRYMTPDMIRVTAYGREYWERLTAPQWYWFRHNWFPASVPGATILVSLVAAIANIVNLVLK